MDTETFETSWAKFQALRPWVRSVVNVVLLFLLMSAPLLLVASIVYE